MVKHLLDQTYAALSDSTRRAILARLATDAEVTVGELAAPFDVSLPAISKHIQVLENAGLVRRRREGRHHHLRLDPAPLREASRWIEEQRRFWDQQLDSLTDYLEAETSRRASDGLPPPSVSNEGPER